MVGSNIVIRFSLVHSGELMATRSQSEARLVSASSGRVFTFHSCYSRSFRGVFFMDYGAFIYLGVYYGSCIFGPYPFLYWFGRLRGLVVIVAWSSLNDFVLVLVSHDITSFQPLYWLGVYVGRSPVISGVRISRCLFFFFSPDIRDFLSSCLGSRVWRFETCASFSSQVLGVSPGLCPLGCSCQPERLHGHPLAIAIAVASASDVFISGAFHLQWCSHLTFVLFVLSYVSVLSWCLLSSMVDQFHLQSFL